MSAVLENQEVRVKGTVQGVGFRPTVYRLALECGLNGEVSNDTDGVLIRLSGIQTNIREFLQRLQNEAPPLATIDSIDASVVDDDWQYQNFSIGRSAHSAGRTEVAADAASCRACLREVADPGNRRYRYPFTNCTHCGPRLSIIQGVPYDRSSTTMAAFALCPQCQQEYSDPLNRRFHAQPLACHQCGPSLSIHEAGRSVDASEQTHQLLQRVDRALMAGKIVAIKGLGGFHLCCDARNHLAVQSLRQRKQRYAKPFALMSADLNGIRQFCVVSALEEETLRSVAAPIVLLKARQDGSNPPLSSAIAPGSGLLGFMLPYTPLHALICQQFAGPLVMTSGNLSGEPQIIDNAEAITQLSAIADLILYHDRDIANRIDDSVVRCIAGRARILRRARGYAPKSIALPDGFQQADGILAYGAELKSTFCLIKQGAAIVSQHQGDLEDLTTFDDYEHNLALYQRLFEFAPRHLAFDQHPEYISSKLARRDAEALQLPSVGIQHHHAHIASAMAENLVPLGHPPLLGIAFDGLGYGEDGTLWGGEFILATYAGAERLARLKPVAMPGAAQAIMQPWRNTYAHILNSMSWAFFTEQYGDTALAQFMAQQPIGTLDTMLREQINCPLASSAGRLFDAVAAAIGVHAQQVQFEGQAAIELEMLAGQGAHDAPSPGYWFRVEKSPATDGESASPLFEINAASIWPPLLDDLRQGVPKAVIARRFHAGLIDAIVLTVDLLRLQTRFDDIALSGGCMQNAILLQGLEQALTARHFKCLTHAVVPANDGGIALGQAVIAAARIAADVNSQSTPKERLCV